MDGEPPPPLPPPPHPASAKISRKPKTNGGKVDIHLLAPVWFRRAMAQVVAARTIARISRPLRPGVRGGMVGSGRERGALTEGAVVVTVTVTLVAELSNVAGLGETVQVASEGTPVQVKVTVPDNPPSPPTLKV